MAVNYIKTYADVAADAQRQQKLADFLQKQADQPLDMPTYQGFAAMPSYAAGLAKILSAYGARKAGERAEESQKLAKKIGREEFKDYMSAFEPTERKLGTALDVAAARPEDQTMAAMLPQNLDMGEIAKSIGAPTAGIAPQGTGPQFQSPQFAVGGAPMTAGQRRAKLLEGLASDNPMIAAAAQAEYAKKPEEFDIQNTSQGMVRVGKTTGQVTPLTMGGVQLTPRDAYSMGMTPQQKAEYDLNVRKFGIDQANLMLAQRKASDEGVDVSGIGVPRAPAAPAAAGAVTPTAAAPRQPRPTQAAPGQAPGQPPAPQGNVPLIDNPQIAPKQKRELMLKQPQMKASTSSMLSEAAGIDNMAADLLNHSGLDRITGPFGQIKTTDLNEEARSARAVYDAMKGKVALLRVSMAKAEGSSGGAYGNLTENEWPRLEQSLGAIGLAQDGESLRTAITNFRSALNAITNNTKGIYNDTYGKLDFSPPEYTPASKRYPRQGQTGQRSNVRSQADAIIGAD